MVGSREKIGNSRVQTTHFIPTHLVSGLGFFPPMCLGNTWYALGGQAQALETLYEKVGTMRTHCSGSSLMPFRGCCCCLTISGPKPHEDTGPGLAQCSGTVQHQMPLFLAAEGIIHELRLNFSCHYIWTLNFWANFDKPVITSIWHW